MYRMTVTSFMSDLSPLSLSSLSLPSLFPSLSLLSLSPISLVALYPLSHRSLLSLSLPSLSLPSLPSLSPLSLIVRSNRISSETVSQITSLQDRVSKLRQLLRVATQKIFEQSSLPNNLEG